ncbi:MAG: glucose 1-dehydrogenase [Bernardetiaceae bacterium]|jgi:NAD(P)-dependent dehydrogenase (short-subunit alcohol dehydrogenase family)|nr:glucose 1-dehydrogenase [Bernardetiaceae bacterium]
MFKLDGKTAVVTGGGSGIGRAIAELFVRQGAQVIILELNAEAGQEVLAGIHQQGGRAWCLPANVADHAQVQAVFGQIAEQFGRVDILVNNAGIAHIGNLENTAEADFDRIFQVNVKGVYNCLAAAVPRMVAQGGGVVLNMDSVAALVGIPDRFAYTMSKGAVWAMTLSVARDYVQKGIRCNCISPARVHTPFVDGFLAKNYPGQEAEMFAKLAASQPMGRMGQPSEVASLALFLCSDEAGFITGCNYPIDGGFVHLK